MSARTTLTQRTIPLTEDIETWGTEFILDRKVRGLSDGTIRYYQQKLKIFLRWCEAQLILDFSELTPQAMRHFLIYLDENGYTPGGIHAVYRAIKAFLNWWEEEFEPEGWRNPIKKVRPPKISIAPIEGIEIQQFKQLIEACKGGKFTDLRDTALLFFLIDTGIRAGELCAINLDDLDRTFHSVNIRLGKGGKPRMVFLSKKSRRHLRKYLRARTDSSQALWVTINGRRIKYGGLRELIKRRANIVGVSPPKLHDFRRSFALQCLRNGMDVYSLQKLMGHADLQVLQRYLAQTTEDIHQAHRLGSPVDNMNL